MNARTKARAHRDARVGLRTVLDLLQDDRAQPIRRIDRADLVRASKSDNPGLALLADRLRIAIRSESRRNTPDRVVLMVVLILSVMFFYGIASTVMGSVMGVRGAGIGLLILIAMVLVATRVHRWYIRRGALHQIARTAVAEGVCGSCAFSLEGGVTEPDGCVVCPECGAAWRAERVVSPFWSKPTFPVLRWNVVGWITPGVRGPSSLFAPDDRGRYVQSPDSRLMTVRAKLTEGITPDERVVLVRSMRRVGRWWRVLFMLCVSWLPGGLLYLCWALYQEGERLAMWILLGAAVPLLIAVLMIPLGSAFGGPHRTARTIVRHGRCGSCLRPLADAPADRDGRRVCPLCGAAWLTPEPVPAEP